MDYKYINQLLDRYWKAETSLEEEEILRAFFSQDELPAELKPYKALFSSLTKWVRLSMRHWVMTSTRR